MKKPIKIEEISLRFEYSKRASLQMSQCKWLFGDSMAPESIKHLRFAASTLFVSSRFSAIGGSSLQFCGKNVPAARTTDTLSFSLDCVDENDNFRLRSLPQVSLRDSMRLSLVSLVL